MDQSADELSAGALHAGDDGTNAIRNGTIKVSRNGNILLWWSGFQG